jgi:hypothetical protein
MLSTKYCSVVYYILLSIVWFGNFATVAPEPRFTTNNENGLCRQRATPLSSSTAERRRYFRGRALHLPPPPTSQILFRSPPMSTGMKSDRIGCFPNGGGVCAACSRLASCRHLSCSSKARERWRTILASVGSITTWGGWPCRFGREREP